MRVRRNGVTAVSGVVRVDPDNSPPKFAGDMMRFVPENTPGHRYVDEPITASDPGDDLVYSLGGDDDTLFYIARNTVDHRRPRHQTISPYNDIETAGQIRVGALTELDYEEKAAYSVEVTAIDTYNATDTTGVTINVVNVDEAPVISVGGLNVSGRNSMDYAENGTSAVATYTASGPDADATGVSWSLLGDDAGDFSISNGGELSFRLSPNYESAGGRRHRQRIHGHRPSRRRQHHG